MTTRVAVNLVLQWGRPTPVGYHPGGATPVGATLLYPPAAPVWAVVKGGYLLRGWTRSARVTGRVTRRWVTLGVRVTRPGRWAHRGRLDGLHGGYTSGTAVDHLVRTRRFDYARWGAQVRGVTHPAGPAALVTHAEAHLLRRRYV